MIYLSLLLAFVSGAVLMTAIVDQMLDRWSADSVVRMLMSGGGLGLAVFIAAVL